MDREDFTFKIVMDESERSNYSASPLFTIRKTVCSSPVIEAARPFDDIQCINQQLHAIEYSKITNHKIQFMISVNSYVFRHRNAIHRRYTSTKGHRSKTVIQAINTWIIVLDLWRLFRWTPSWRRSSAVPVGVHTYHKLYFLYFTGMLINP
jgi:hypothetical protein